ncbi:hypothetical protein SEA_ARCHIE_123 [Mycobacterium phage Archie]|uniref:Uncharacterized protein n=1 Tax=Mycobacterium phage Archie TaxID=1718599 RepID=A0A0M4R280_9CAUD|nr:hypothetical protein AVU85_gp120 [Mycobacterium phage Archie]ALF00417.1 hypothetical protein SEA_ARCHIE_123 [Mycobacterium phage Archie]
MSNDTKEQQINDILELLNAPVEPLHPDLAEYLHNEGPLGVPMLKHPLVFNMLHTERENARANACYAAKREALSKALSDGNWTSYVFLHERPYRLDAFSIIRDRLTNNDAYWPLLGLIWTDSENIWENRGAWRRRLTDPKRVADRETLMSNSDHNTLCGLPSSFEVYRGFNDDGDAEGLSWTLNIAKARWFATRFSQTGATVATGTVDHSDVIAYFSGRNEDEIVVLPENVQGMTLKAV